MKYKMLIINIVKQNTDTPDDTSKNSKTYRA